MVKGVNKRQDRTESKTKDGQPIHLHVPGDIPIYLHVSNNGINSNLTSDINKKTTNTTTHWVPPPAKTSIGKKINFIKNYLLTLKLVQFLVYLDVFVYNLMINLYHWTLFMKITKTWLRYVNQINISVKLNFVYDVFYG